MVQPVSRTQVRVAISDVKQIEIIPVPSKSQNTNQRCSRFLHEATGILRDIRGFARPRNAADKFMYPDQEKRKQPVLLYYGCLNRMIRESDGLGFDYGVVRSPV